MRHGLLHFGWLWLSQIARALADSYLVTLVVLRIVHAGQTDADISWQWIVPWLFVPLILVAPIAGITGNILPRRWGLPTTAFLCMVSVFVVGWLVGSEAEPWRMHLGLSVVAIAAAIYSPIYAALLPAAARDLRWPLLRVNGCSEMGTALACVAGVILAMTLQDAAFPLGLAVVLNAIGFCAALLVDTPIDADELASAAPLPSAFLCDCRSVARDRDAATALIGLAWCSALLLLVLGMLFTYTGRTLSRGSLFWAGCGIAVGALLAGVQGHPCRSLGLVPLGATGLALALACLGEGPPSSGSSLMLGALAGLMMVPLRTAFQAAMPPATRINGMALSNALNCALMLAVAMLWFGLRSDQLTFAVGLTVLAALTAWWVFMREGLEVLLEILSFPFYRVRAHGPGLERIPSRGPLLVIINHNAWFDPLWLGKVWPRRLTPMMTSIFFDVPVLHFLMAHVTHAIRVQDSKYRRDAPELEEVVARLDRGECVLVFPEGRVRRRGDQPPRRFGQGVWHILRQRPTTPVVACWSEGGWGTFTSYCGGKPMRHLAPDWWRHIDIAVSEPEVIEASVLADKAKTRDHLRRMCINARRHLGLPPVEE